MMARPRGGLLSLRTLTFALILLFAAVSLVTMTMVVWTADVVWASIHTADRARQKLEAAQSFEHDLREFHRLGSLWIATHEESVGQAYVVAGDDLRRSEIDLERLLDRSDERRLVAQLVTEVAIDRVARRSAEASGGPIDDTIRSMTALHRQTTALGARRSRW